MKAIACRYARPRTVDEAIETLESAGGDGTIIAGGVALGILMNEGLATPSYLIDISRLDPLRRIEMTSDGRLSIGAAVTNAEVLHSELVRTSVPLLIDMAHEIACDRVRNRGTIGGNICLADPQGDPPVALLALDAVLRARSSRGTRDISISDFFKDLYTTALDRDELLEAILVSPPPANSRTGYGKFAARRAMDYSSTVSVAVAAYLDPQDQSLADIRIGMGGVGPTPVRTKAAEVVLRGRRLSAAAVDAARAALAEELSPLSDILYSADYKRHVAGVMLKRTLLQALGLSLEE